MRRRKVKRESKTMNQLPPINVEYVVDESVNSLRRNEEIVEILYQMMLHQPKRGRPRKVESWEESDAA